MDESNVVGERIRALRKQNRMTLKQLGDLLGVQSSVVAKYEKGYVTNLKTSTIKRMAEIFNVSSLYIMGYEDNPASLQAEMIEVFSRLTAVQQRALINTAKAMVK